MSINKNELPEEVRCLLKETYTKWSKISPRYQCHTSLKAVTDNEVECFEYLKNVEDYVDEFVNRYRYNLLITSESVGTGKTTWATRIGMSYIEKYACNYSFSAPPVLFVDVPDFLRKKKETFSSPEYNEEFVEFEHNLYKSRLVIFDEIGHRTLTDYERDLLLGIIDYRTQNNLPCIYTSNIPVDKLPDVIGARLADRIIKYSRKILHLDGFSRRGLFD